MSKGLPARYYQKKRKTSKKSNERYQDLSKEERNKKQDYGRERYKNLPEDKNKD